MSWEDFLERAAREFRSLLDSYKAFEPLDTRPAPDTPGKVMVCFVNRYMKALDGVKYRIRFDGKELAGTTSENAYCIELQPASLSPVRVWVWSHHRGDYKELDPVRPRANEPVLVRKRLDTLKVLGQTDTPEKPKAPAPRPDSPRSAPPPAPSPESAQGVQPLPPERDERGNPLIPVERPVPDRITVEQLRTIFPKNKRGAPSDAHLQAVIDELNIDLARFKLDTVFRRAHFFGQLKRESGPTLSGAAESLSYSPARLMSTFSYYAARPNEAQSDGAVSISSPSGEQVKPAVRETIANKAYGPHGSGPTLGNVEPGDGWRFRGRGMKQLTGRLNYRAFSNSHRSMWGENLDFEQEPDLVAGMPYAIRSAVFFWVENRCWRAADSGISEAAIDAVTKIVNSGEIRKHAKGKYPKDSENPVLLRRNYVKLAYAAFT